MTVKEMRDLLNLPGLGHDDDQLSIVLSERSLPSVAKLGIKTASFGFDWDSGHLMLYPVEPVVRKKQKLS